MINRLKAVAVRNLEKMSFTQELIQRYKHYRVDCYVVSYPKSGRTWLRVMLAKALAVHFNISYELVSDPIATVHAAGKRHPWIRFTHLNVSISKEHIDFQKWYATKFRNKKVIFLVRDPRDVLVSYFFHRTRRNNEEHSLENFIKHPAWGIDRLISFMNDGYTYRHLPKDFLLIQYEDLHHDGKTELKHILEFVGIENILDNTVEQALEYAQFDNMRKMSMSTLSDNKRLKPITSDDPESFKVRKGKIGGFTEYLSSSDIAYLNDKIRHDLLPVFGYKNLI
ncbi:MAG: hypothetical protein B6242_11555 [Anaerolineaceae bacterium 4572_78]|nr:MAG: hypothetical protein B6242_11555 [Anaerolineaceae bacterium 4572_78]